MEAAAAYGLDSLADGRGLGLSDFDGDGDVDLVVNNYLGQAQFFVNQVADGHWLQVRLRGRESNRDGIGAVIRVETSEGSAPGRQMRVVTAGDGYASQYSRVAHFGLAGARVLDRLEVTWPGGERQEFLDVAVDRLVEIDENGELRLVREGRETPRLARRDEPGEVCLTPPKDEEAATRESGGAAP